MICTFYKQHFDKTIVMSSFIDKTSLIDQPIVKSKALTTKQKQHWSAKATIVNRQN